MLRAEQPLAACLSSCTQLARPDKDRGCKLAPRHHTSFSNQFSFLKAEVQFFIHLWSPAGRLALGVIGVLGFVAIQNRDAKWRLGLEDMLQRALCSVCS